MSDIQEIWEPELCCCPQMWNSLLSRLWWQDVCYREFRQQLKNISTLLSKKRGVEFLQ